MEIIWHYGIVAQVAEQTLSPLGVQKQTFSRSSIFSVATDACEYQANEQVLLHMAIKTSLAQFVQCYWRPLIQSVVNITGETY